MVAAEEMQNNAHTPQAILLYEKARNYDPSLKSVSHHLAVLYDAQGDSARSLAEYNKALQSDPKNPNLLSDMGYYYYERENFVEA
jgi:Tfp pilus assembly protein PilF